MLTNSYWLASILVAFGCGIIYRRVLNWMGRKADRRFGGVYAGPDQYHYRTEPQADFYPQDTHQSHTDFRFFERRFEREVDALISRSEAAENQGDKLYAIEIAESALQEVDAKLGRDHVKAVAVLTRLGYLNFQEGFLRKAKEYWEQALSVASEWPSRCREDVDFVKTELAKVTDQLGY